MKEAPPLDETHWGSDRTPPSTHMSWRPPSGSLVAKPFPETIAIFRRVSINSPPALGGPSAGHHAGSRVLSLLSSLRHPRARQPGWEPRVTQPGVAPELAVRTCSPGRVGHDGRPSPRRFGRLISASGAATTATRSAIRCARRSGACSVVISSPSSDSVRSGGGPRGGSMVTRRSRTDFMGGPGQRQSRSMPGSGCGSSTPTVISAAMSVRWDTLAFSGHEQTPGPPRPRGPGAGPGVAPRSRTVTCGDQDSGLGERRDQSRCGSVVCTVESKRNPCRKPWRPGGGRRVAGGGPVAGRRARGWVAGARGGGQR